MAEITITIPDDKISLLADAVRFYMENEAGGEEIEFSLAIAANWTKQKMIAELKRLVRNYQEQEYREEFEFLDPLD